jgi:hypothetical protein
MKIPSMCSGKLTLTGMLAGCLLMAATIPAQAGLGADAGSVDADVTAMRGAMAQPTADELPQQSGSYNVKTFVTGSGTTVHEYSAPSGTVFAVSWRGHRPPDLSVLLGAYYSEYSSASAVEGHRDLHRAMVATPNIVVTMGGHMGHAAGSAYVPSLVPSGVDAKAVVK